MTISFSAMNLDISLVHFLCLIVLLFISLFLLIPNSFLQFFTIPSLNHHHPPVVMVFSIVLDSGSSICACRVLTGIKSCAVLLMYFFLAKFWVSMKLKFVGYVLFLHYRQFFQCYRRFMVSAHCLIYQVMAGILWMSVCSFSYSFLDLNVHYFFTFR